MRVLGGRGARDRAASPSRLPSFVRLPGHEPPQLPADRRLDVAVHRRAVARAKPPRRLRAGASRSRSPPACSPPASPTPTSRSGRRARAARRRRCSSSSTSSGRRSAPRSAASSSRSAPRSWPRCRSGCSPVLKTLALRDQMTARHSAAVARYSRAIAKRVGLSEREQDLIHTAGAVPRHRQVHLPGLDPARRPQAHRRGVRDRQAPPGAGRRARRRIDGYGPVAEIVLAHHERIDGRGYPYGLAGDADPARARASSPSPTPTT